MPRRPTVCPVDHEHLQGCPTCQSVIHECGGIYQLETTDRYNRPEIVDEHRGPAPDRPPCPHWREKGQPADCPHLTCPWLDYPDAGLRRDEAPR